MGIFTPGEQRNTEYHKLKYSTPTPDQNDPNLCRDQWFSHDQQWLMIDKWSLSEGLELFCFLTSQ